MHDRLVQSLMAWLKYLQLFVKNRRSDTGDLNPSAAREFQTVIQLDPNYTNAYGNLANVFMGQGKLDEAITQYQNTVEMAPGSAQAHFRLGEALEKKGRTADAIEQFRETLQLNPNHQDAKTHLRNLGALTE